MKKLFFLCLLITNIVASKLVAQSSINCGGGNGSGSNGSIAFSVGQIDYISASSANASFSLGVQQAYKLNANKISVIDYSMYMYPNPVSDYLNIKYPFIQDTKFVIFSTTGNIMLSGDIQKSEGIINLKAIAPGIYYIKIDNKINKLIKI